MFSWRQSQPRSEVAATLEICRVYRRQGHGNRGNWPDCRATISVRIVLPHENMFPDGDGVFSPQIVALHRHRGLRLFLPESWTSDPIRMSKARVPPDRQGFRRKTEIAIDRSTGSGWAARGSAVCSLTPAMA